MDNLNKKSTMNSGQFNEQWALLKKQTILRFRDKAVLVSLTMAGECPPLIRGFQRANK